MEENEHEIQVKIVASYLLIAGQLRATRCCVICVFVQVFHAPHIANMSQYLLNTRFEPIIYRLGENNTIVSNVKFSSVLGSGWLSAAGKMRMRHQLRCHNSCKACRCALTPSWFFFNCNAIFLVFPLGVTQVLQPSTPLAALLQV